MRRFCLTAPLLVATFSLTVGTSLVAAQSEDVRPTWLNSGVCKSRAELDSRVRKTGASSLHIVNPTPAGPRDYGTTVQAVRIVPYQKYRVRLWARAKDLASDGAVTVSMDRECKVQPIRLPRGSYDWTLFSGTFSLPEDVAHFRVIAADQGEVWIDGLELTAAELLVADTQSRSAPAKDPLVSWDFSASANPATKSEGTAIVDAKVWGLPGGCHMRFGQASWMEAAFNVTDDPQARKSLPVSWNLTVLHLSPRLSKETAGYSPVRITLNGKEIWRGSPKGGGEGPGKFWTKSVIDVTKHVRAGANTLRWENLEAATTRYCLRSLSVSGGPVRAAETNVLDRR